MKISNLGYTNMLLVILILFLGAFSLFFYFQNNSIPRPAKITVESLNPNLIVYVNENKLFRFNFKSLKSDEFQGNEAISDGAKFYFNKNRNVFAVINKPLEKNGFITKVFIYDMNSLEKKAVIDGIKFNYFDFLTLSISQDGQKIAIVESIGKDIKIYDDKGKSILDIKNPENRKFELQSWSPDSSKLLYKSTKQESEISGSFGSSDYKDSNLIIFDLYTKKSTELKLQEIISKNIEETSYDVLTQNFIWSTEDEISFFNPTEDYQKIPVRWSYSIKSNSSTKDANFKYYKNFLKEGSNYTINKNQDLTLYLTHDRKLMLYNLSNNKSTLIYNLSKYPRAAVSVNPIWLNDEKSIILQIDQFCGGSSCTLTKDEIEFSGVFKVNTDGTNWQKLNNVPMIWN